MNKIAKISLIASLAITSFTSAHADSLADAFAASKFKGEIKSQYFTKKDAAGNESSIWTNGGNLSVTTGSYYGLSAGATFQTGHVANVDGSGYDGDMNANGSTLSQAYIQYIIDNTTFKAGRQYMHTPLIAGSGSRMFKQSFEGYLLSNTDLPDTTLMAGYVTKYQHRTSLSSGSTTIGDAPFFADVGDNGAYTLYAKNSSIENLELQAQYVVLTQSTDDKKALYADAVYKMGDITLGAQLYNTDDGSTLDNGQIFGLKAEGTFSGVHAKVAFTKSGADQQTVFNGLGSAADSVFTATPVGSHWPYVSDTTSYQVALGYKFDNGFGLNAIHTHWDVDSASITETETDLIASYKFSKNLSTQLWYTSFGEDTAEDYQTRLYLSYSF